MKNNKTMVLMLTLLCSATAYAETTSTRVMAGSLQMSGASASGQYAKEMQRAEKAYSSEDVVTALAILEKIAKQGYVPAQVRLGELLDYAEENQQAVSWYRKAADQGDAAGQYRLGMMYAIGEGVTKDPRQAMSWIRKAADQNYVNAVRSLAHAYRTGDLGVTVDLEQANYWSRKVPAGEAGEAKK